MMNFSDKITGFLFIVFIPLLFGSCVKDLYRESAITQFKNNSKSTLTITFYEKNEKSWEIPEIKSDSVGSRASGLFPLKDGKHPIIFYTPLTDSAIVLFDSNKRLVYLSKKISKIGAGYISYDDPRSIMNEGNYEKNIPEFEQPLIYHVDFRFIFTEEDYKKAVEQ